MRGAEGINPKDWTLRELRHGFASILSDQRQLRPVVQSGAVIMDRIFDMNEGSWSLTRLGPCGIPRVSA
jgi:hypothetical protein